MKNALLLAILFVASNAFSQTNTIKVTKPVMTVQPEKMDILYAGVNNPLSISVSGKVASKVLVSMSRGIITGESGEYLAFVSTPGTVTIYAYEQTDGSNTRLIDSVVMRVKSIPAPYAFVAGKRNGSEVTITELNNAVGVIPMMEDFDFDMRTAVDSFEATLLRGNVAEHYKSATAKISPQMRTAFATLKPGDSIYFERIFCRMPDNRERMIEPMVLRIK
jgi:hypothetical protein